MPFFADALEIDCSGRVKHRQAWSLPGLENGSYSEAVVDGDELLLVAHYTTAGGAGHLLARLPLGRLSDPQLGNLVLNAGGPSEVPTVQEREEERGEGADEPQRLVAGGHYSPWAGLGVVGERVLLGAGDRGVMVLPRAFEADSRVELVDLGGTCLDLAVRGAEVLALVASGSAARVATLRFDPSVGAFRKVGDLGVEGSWEQLVR